MLAKPYSSSRAADLAERILHHKALYYAGHPEISDAAFDALEDELRQLAPTHPALAVVGADLTTDLPKVAHSSPMLSLQKTYDLDELLKWVGTEPVVGTLKIDGVSISLLYRDGSLVMAKTRGNGVIGEDVTPKVRWVTEVLPALPGISGDIEIRGELYCTDSRFIQLTETMQQLGLECPTSPRNIVAGLMGRKSHINLARFFGFFAFHVSSSSVDLGLKTETEQIAWLAARGFVLPKPERLEGQSAVAGYIERVRDLLAEGEIPLDGAVFTYDSIARQHALGLTSHHPRYKMSFKWQGQTATTRIQDVAWATSRLGIVTPVAIVAPVILSGATITNVTLHNAAHVKAYNLKAGDDVEIVRSGEVIPKFLQVVHAAEGEYRWPDACPSCAATLVFDDVRLKCPNELHCSAQQLGAVLNWIRAAEIEDLSEKRLAPLMELGLVRTMADLYRLNVEDFYRIPQTKEKMATKLYANIQKSRHLPLAQFLNGLGIEGSGLTTWEKLLAEFPTLDAILQASQEQLAAIDGFAEKTAAQIVLGLEVKRPLIDDLLAAGVVPKAATAATGEGPLSGQVFVITGALSQPRATVEKAIKAAGGRLSGSVAKTTHAVITDEPDSVSSKMQKAKALGIPVWSEARLWRAIEGLVDGDAMGSDDSGE